jgi:hypothetical protein
MPNGNENRELELPELRDELDRKAAETLERLVRHQEQGKISPDAMKVGVRAVWETISGLANDSVCSAASAIHREVGEAMDRQVRLFRDIESGAFACSLQWTPGTCRVAVLKRSGKVDTFDCGDETEAKSKFSLLGDRLAGSYEEWR